MSSYDSPAQEEAGAVQHQPARKFRRMGQAVSTADMGVMGAFQYLKSEARDLKAAGVSWLLASGEATMQPFLAPYMTGTASRSYEDEVGEDYLEKNSAIF